MGFYTGKLDQQQNLGAEEQIGSVFAVQGLDLKNRVLISMIRCNKILL